MAKNDAPKDGIDKAIEKYCVDLDPVKHATEVLLYVKAEKGRLKDMFEAAAEVVQKHMGDKPIGLLGKRQAVSWEKGTTSRFNLDRLKKERNDIYLEYLETDIPTRPFIPIPETEDDGTN